MLAGILRGYQQAIEQQIALMFGRNADQTTKGISSVLDRPIYVLDFKDGFNLSFLTRHEFSFASCHPSFHFLSADRFRVLRCSQVGEDAKHGVTDIMGHG